MPLNILSRLSANGVFKHDTRPSMRARSFSITLATLFAIGVTRPSLATEQENDAVTFGNQHFEMAERPLNDYLRRLPKLPRFDIPSTANYKGYSASWEVRNARLFLASFNATVNKHPVPIASLFPDGKLPIQATWFSGTIHILRGNRTLEGGYYTYERVTALRVTNGVVIATNDMRNVRQDSLTR